ncbi:methyltransferase-like protein 7A [Elysia marginata]|uniref:Methyltransferase-like protein 7A n=1 Tax=Elysia marginata TaxID=1093978 RepID=A0AAV4J1F6_9GAST|nr:methyltransferase-like protein 7A [Elysia marginata]
MARVDAEVSFLLAYIILPILSLFLVSRYLFELNLKKLESLVLRRTCAWLSRRYLEKEKQLLFKHLGDIKQTSRRALSILEIGIGSGENFQYYPRGVHFSCVEPNHHYDSVWKKKLEKFRHIRLDECFHLGAEDMPDVKSNMYDVVVCTLVLCSVMDPAAVLREIHRVLKPVSIFCFCH